MTNNHRNTHPPPGWLTHFTPSENAQMTIVRRESRTMRVAAFKCLVMDTPCREAKPTSHNNRELCYTSKTRTAKLKNAMEMTVPKVHRRTALLCTG